MSFESVRLLLQREDQPAALAALRDHLEECPNDVDPPGVPKADDLVTALTAADWDVTVDEHGDIVGLRYLVDKAPRDSTETFPYYLLYALAPYIRYGKFARWEEQDAGLSLFVVGRRERLREIHHRRAARLVQLGGPSTVPTNGSVEVAFRVAGYGVADGDPVRVEANSTQADCALDAAHVPAGGTGRMRITQRPGALDPLDVRVRLDAGNGALFEEQIACRLEPGPDTIRKVVAQDSPLDDPEWSADGDDIPGNWFPAAHEALRRYAVRYGDRPGARFLRAVADASDVHGALRAAGLEMGPTNSGGAAGFRFVADELPGYERYFWGLFAALEGSYAGESGFRLAFADDPGTWVEYASYYRSGCYEWGQPWRWLVPRR
jgi:hypothetical protein